MVEYIDSKHCCAGGGGGERRCRYRGPGNSPGPEAFLPGLIVTMKLICAQMAMRWEEQAERKKGLLQSLVRSRVACVGEALGNGALDPPPAQDEGSEEPPRPHLCMGLLSSESMFPGVSTRQVGPVQTWGTAVLCSDGCQWP